jgi:hypothetical protein
MIMTPPLRSLALLLTAALLAGLTGPAGAATDAALAERLFRGFATCTINDGTRAARAALMQRLTPAVKKEEFWRYTVDFTVLGGLPATGLELGVCDGEGHQACGWAAYHAVVIPLSLAEVRTYLRQMTGIDYTQERRDEETNITLQPILIDYHHPGESIAFCDPGVL